MPRTSFVGSSERILERLREGMARLFSDKSLSMRIVYISKGTRTFTASSGAHSGTDVEIQIDAVKLAISDELKAVYQTGTHVFMIDAKNLDGRGIKPKMDDKLKEYVDENGNAGDELPLLAIRHDPVMTSSGRIFYEFIVSGK